MRTIMLCVFEKIVLRTSEGGAALTLGEIAEALLFYQNVHLVLDGGALQSLLRTLGMRPLLSLLARDNVTAVYTEEMLATRTDRNTGEQLHGFATVMMAGGQDTGPLKSRKARLAFLLQRLGHDRREARRLAERFFERVPTHRFSSDYFVAGGITKAAYLDVQDERYVNAAIERAVMHTPGLTLPARLRFDVAQRPGGFAVYTNIDFEGATARRSVMTPPLGPVTQDHLLSAMLDASADTVLSAHYGGEFYTSAMSSDMVRVRYAELLKRTGISASELRDMQDIVLNGYPRVRDVINSGERKFDDFLSLLDKSERFRHWVRNVNPDTKLVAEYLREVTAEGWMSSLPVKAIRYVVGSAIGLGGVAAGLVASALDTFLLDRIMRGWRPSHFVDGELKPFLDAGGHEQGNQ